VPEITCVAGKLEMLAVTLPICAVPAEREAVTTPMRFVPAGRAGRLFTSTLKLESSIIAKRLLYSPPIMEEGLPTFAVTVPEMAGREPMVIELPMVTEPEMGWEAGKFEIETTLPLTALRISVMACVPRLTTVWAVMC
jgi:hypothetical protein